MLKRVLVTGGAGYIGAHVCKALSRAGAEPFVFDNFSTGRKDFVKWGPYFEGTLLRMEDLRDAFLLFQPDSVIHCAALTSVPESVSEPGKYYETNVGGTLNVLRTMEAFAVKPMIFSSSAAVYGSGNGQAVEETSDLAPVNPYGQSKRMGELMLQDFALAGKATGVSLRYFNASGADPEGELGQRVGDPSHLIPILLKIVKEGKRAIPIFGDDYPTRDGSCLRDYVHVSDLATAHVLALARCGRGQVGYEAYNLGSEKGFSVKEVVAAAEKFLGKRLPVSIEGRRPGDPAELISKNALARRELGWNPRFSSLESILKTTWAWMGK